MISFFLFFSAKIIQKCFRRILNKMLYEAFVRDTVEIHRYRAARRLNGRVMRMFGYKKRSQQKQIRKRLNFIGFDPYSFNYRISEVLAETYTDFKEFLEIAHREFGLFRIYHGKRLPTVLGRKKFLEDKKQVLIAEGTVRCSL